MNFDDIGTSNDWVAVGICRDSRERFAECPILLVYGTINTIYRQIA